MRKKSAVAAVTLVLMGMSSSAALAGEVTGTGKSLKPLHGKSICAFSGLNDDPEGLDPANGPAGRTQSFGQDVRLGFIDPTVFNPGDACNPNALLGH